MRSISNVYILFILLISIIYVRGFLPVEYRDASIESSAKDNPLLQYDSLNITMNIIIMDPSKSSEFDNITKSSDTIIIEKQSTKPQEIHPSTPKISTASVTTETTLMAKSTTNVPTTSKRTRLTTARKTTPKKATTRTPTTLKTTTQLATTMKTTAKVPVTTGKLYTTTQSTTKLTPTRLTTNSPWEVASAGTKRYPRGKCIGVCPLDNVGVTFLLGHVDCNKFCICNFGSPVEMNCGPGLHFNAKFKVCDWPNSAQCIPR